MNAALKAAVFIVVFGLSGAISFFLFALMIIAMNGYGESDAQWGIYLFIAWAGIVGLISGVCAVIASSYLVAKRNVNQFAASPISITIFVFLGAIANSVGCAAGLATAELVRTNF